jgi:hypothetical protein
MVHHRIEQCVLERDDFRASGRGVGDVQWFSVEHELVHRSQVFASGNRVAQFVVFNIAVSLRPVIFHSCGLVFDLRIRKQPPFVLTPHTTHLPRKSRMIAGVSV